MLYYCIIAEWNPARLALAGVLTVSAERSVPAARDFFIAYNKLICRSVGLSMWIMSGAAAELAECTKCILKQDGCHHRLCSRPVVQAGCPAACSAAPFASPARAEPPPISRLTLQMCSSANRAPCWRLPLPLPPPLRAAGSWPHPGSPSSQLLPAADPPAFASAMRPALVPVGPQLLPGLPHPPT